jgi:hypothetical protein
LNKNRTTGEMSIPRVYISIVKTIGRHALPLLLLDKPSKIYGNKYNKKIKKGKTLKTRLSLKILKDHELNDDFCKALLLLPN